MGKGSANTTTMQSLALITRIMSKKTGILQWSVSRTAAKAVQYILYNLTETMYVKKYKPKVKGACSINSHYLHELHIVHVFDKSYKVLNFT